MKSSGKWIEDAYEFLTTCRELLEIISLAMSYGVCYVTLQLYGLAREWWRIYLGSMHPMWISSNDLGDIL